jgi:hypothetical protein
MIQIKVELLTIKNSQLEFSVKKPPVAHLLKEALEATQRTLLRDSEPSWHQEEPEELSDLENNSELWMITTAETSTSKNSPRQ